MGDQQRDVVLGFDVAADGSATFVSYDGVTFRYLGTMTSDGLSYDGYDFEQPEAFFTDDAGNQVVVPAVLLPPKWSNDRSVTVTSGCRKCGSALAVCEGCGRPAMCGDAWCVDCQPD